MYAILLTISLLLAIPPSSMAADTSMLTDAHAGTDSRRGWWGPYWVSPDIGALIYIADSTQDLRYSRTIDGGSTWTETTIDTGVVRRCAAYFDKETVGITGDKLHIAWLDSNTDDAVYRTLDIRTNTLGTQRIVDGSNTVSTTAIANRLAITKARSGKIFIAYSTQNEIECWKSSDEFATAAVACADPYEAATQEDWLILEPANHTDASDVVGIFWDRSANKWSFKIYDDSADSWAETVNPLNVVDDATHINMDATTRHSDGFIIMCLHTNDDNANDILVTYQIRVDETLEGAAIQTNIFSSRNNSAQCSVIVNQQNDDIYVAYATGASWPNTANIVYVKSTDDMTTWGTEQTYSQAAAAPFRMISAGGSIGDEGGNVQWAFEQDDTKTGYVNLVNDISISAVTTTTTTLPTVARRVMVVQ